MANQIFDNVVIANKFEDIQNPKIEQDLVVADENLVVKIDF